MSYRESKIKSATRVGDVLTNVEDYKVISELGKGSFGSVYLVEKKNELGEPVRYAMKSLSSPVASKTRLGARGSAQNDSVRKEIEIMKKLDHENFVHIVEVFFETTNLSKTFIVMQYVGCGPVMTELKSNDENEGPSFVSPRHHGCYGESEASKCFHQIISAITFMHDKLIAHRDIKIDNILMDISGNVKISDFGACKQFDDASGLLTDTAGTWAFWSPEMCNESREGPYSAFKADIWAAGLVLYIMVFGKFPYWSDQPLEFFHKVLNFRLVSTPSSTVTGNESSLTNFNIIDEPIIQSELNHFPSRKSPEFEHLVLQMMHQDPTARYSAEDCMASEWVTGPKGLRRVSISGSISPISSFGLSMSRLPSSETEEEEPVSPESIAISPALKAKLGKWAAKASKSNQQKMNEFLELQETSLQRSISQQEERVQEAREELDDQSSEDSEGNDNIRKEENLFLSPNSNESPTVNTAKAEVVSLGCGCLLS